MKAVLAFVKAHVISLASGLAALIFIVIGVLGMLSDSVVRQMQERINQPGVSNISSLKSQARNPAWIEAEAERAKLFQKEYEDTREVARRINERKPLLDNVFPVVEREAVAYDFRDAYVQALEKLPHGKLLSGDRPGDRELADAAQDIADREARRREEQEGGGGTVRSIGDRTPASPGGLPGLAPAGEFGPPRMGGGPAGEFGPPRLSGGLGGELGRPGGYSGGGFSSGPVAELGDPKTDFKARAAVAKARSVRCYVSPLTTFHISPIWDPGAKPEPAEMWYAQVGLWIQQDIVNAIAELNDEAARKLKDDEQYVENLPVKRLQSVRVWGYVTPTGTVYFRTYSPAGGASAAEPPPSFTSRKSDEQFDVVRFGLTAVVDQRVLPRFIDAITRQNFYQLIHLKYDRVPYGSQDLADGYLYGAAPVIRVDLDFEGYMARSVYEPMFPAAVREALGLGSKK